MQNERFRAAFQFISSPLTNVSGPRALFSSLRTCWLFALFRGGGKKMAPLFECYYTVMAPLCISSETRVRGVRSLQRWSLSESLSITAPGPSHNAVFCSARPSSSSLSQLPSVDIDFWMQ